MKKKILVIATISVLAVSLFPIRMNLKDGGSVRYQSLTYSITKVHSLITDEEAAEEGKVKPYDEGWIIELFGFTILDTVQ